MGFQEQWIALSTIFRKEVVRFTRIWVQTLIPPVITMTLYFVIFGTLIGSRIGQMDGFNYMEFVIPGLIMMAIITNSYSNVASSFFSVKFQKSIEEVLFSPTPNYVILLGYVLGGVARGLSVGVIVTIVSMFFADINIYHLPLTIGIVILTSVAFALAGFLNAIFAKSFDDISIIPTFVLTPLTYLGGIFYSISLLPDFWQIVSKFNPVLYMVNAFRYGILGISDIDIVSAFLGVIVFILLLACTCLYLLSNSTRMRS